MPSLLEDSASKFYKNIVNEKADHIDNVALGAPRLATNNSKYPLDSFIFSLKMVKPVYFDQPNKQHLH